MSLVWHWCSPEYHSSHLHPYRPPSWVWGWCSGYLRSGMATAVLKGWTPAVFCPLDRGRPGVFRELSIGKFWGPIPESCQLECFLDLSGCRTKIRSWGGQLFCIFHDLCWAFPRGFSSCLGDLRIGIGLILAVFRWILAFTPENWWALHQYFAFLPRNEPHQ